MSLIPLAPFSSTNSPRGSRTQRRERGSIRNREAQLPAREGARLPARSPRRGHQACLAASRAPLCRTGSLERDLLAFVNDLASHDRGFRFHVTNRFRFEVKDIIAQDDHVS
jgi:hypothetical protein